MKKTVKLLAARILSSSDIYTKPDREPNRSIHFVTCHDGFTLADLVSYSKKKITMPMGKIIEMVAVITLVPIMG